MRDSRGMADGGAVLRVRNLTVKIETDDGRMLTAVDGVAFAIDPGEILGLVGESGAGKSLTGAAIARLLDRRVSLAGGEVYLGDERIDTLPDDRFRSLRGGRIAMIFQDPNASLNPLITIGDQLIETILTHQAWMTRAEARLRAIALLQEVGFPGPVTRMQSYPHVLSGGMRQRVVIALALAGDPDLLVADEPTTALDVSIQAQIIALLRRLSDERGLAVILISHDIGVVGEIADSVAVMYAGRIVETGPAGQVLVTPAHPYTQAMLAAIPGLEASADRLFQIPGSMPGLAAIPSGCAFRPRCTNAGERCRERPPETGVTTGHTVACWLAAPSAARHDAGCVDD